MTTIVPSPTSPRPGHRTELPINVLESQYLIKKGHAPLPKAKETAYEKLQRKADKAQRELRRTQRALSDEKEKGERVERELQAELALKDLTIFDLKYGHALINDDLLMKNGALQADNAHLARELAATKLALAHFHQLNQFHQLARPDPQTRVGAESTLAFIPRETDTGLPSL